MLGKLFGLFGVAGEIRSLRRDSGAVIEDAKGRFDEDRLRTMATEIRRHIDEGREWLQRPNMGLENVLTHFKSEHRDARRTQRDVDLSVFTLVIIYFRSEQIGSEADDSKRAVEAFVAEWEKDPAETVRNKTIEA
ncbi:MAG: hypothetical protein AAF493_00535 [Pseudomonadota bacterium]